MSPAATIQDASQRSHNADSKPDPSSNGVKDTKASRDVTWYQDRLANVSEVAQDVLRDYSKIHEDQMLAHVHDIRDQAWDVLPYPCIGLFRFLDFSACLSPAYPEVLERVKNGQTFLDLGCCFGQDIRKLVYDGAPAKNLIGVDKESRFIDLGFELFKDKDSIEAKFSTGDVFAPDFLEELRGTIDIIYVGSFLHLFDWEQQSIIVGQISRLLRKAKGSMVFGRHLGMETGGMSKNFSAQWSFYHHSHETISRIFDVAADGKWEVASQYAQYKAEAWGKGVQWRGGSEVKQQYFVATRVE